MKNKLVLAMTWELEPNLTIGNREINQIGGSEITLNIHNFKAITKSIQVIFHHSPRPITCCISCNMFQSSKSICLRTCNLIQYKSIQVANKVKVY